MSVSVEHATPVGTLPATRGHSLRRRRLLSTTVASAAVLAGGQMLAGGQAPAAVHAAASAQVDVVVIGAGFAGLSAARQIGAAGHSMLVLEARNRVGGRVLNHPIQDGEVVEAGAQFIGPTHDHLLALSRAYGMATYATYDQGRSVAVLDGDRTVGGFTPSVARDYQRLIGLLDGMASGLPVDAPWQAPQARQWDAQTFQTWLDAHVEVAEAMAIFPSVANAVWGAEPRDVSLLFALACVAAAGNEDTPGSLTRLLNARQGGTAATFRRRLAGARGAYGRRAGRPAGALGARACHR
ncbi:MAG: FAD-dependent oxidoreductase [Chloroflexi bacterium]|nr:FAD-dependent oxidoreductase [Chloroflexota bacterium]